MAVSVLCPAAAHAQDEPTFGLAMGYPTAVQMLWRMNDVATLRPEFTWARSSNESPSVNDPVLGTIANPTTFDSWQATVGLSALFYVHRVERLRTYVSPRFAYSHSISSSGISNTPTGSNGRGRTYTTSGSFGAEYPVGRHFGVFGELGVSYMSMTTETTLVETRNSIVTIGPGGLVTSTSTFTVQSESHAHSIATRSGVGVIFYF